MQSTAELQTDENVTMADGTTAKKVKSPADRKPKKSSSKAKKVAAKSKPKAHPKKSSKRPSKKASKPSSKLGPRGGKPGNGTRRKTKAGVEFHIMSVHVPLPLLRKLDAAVQKNEKSGKKGASRSEFAVAAIQRLL